eukprot:7346047-Pyramimonas_sp.AAC.1
MRVLPSLGFVAQNPSFRIASQNSAGRGICRYGGKRVGSPMCGGRGIHRWERGINENRSGELTN